MKSFSNETLIFFFSESSVSPTFSILPNCVSSANLVEEIH